ncbi:hypothetical protein ACWIGM_13590 [Bosea sp. NPDC055332]
MLRSRIHAFSRRAATLAVIFVASVALGEAHAADTPDLTGRWSVQRPKLTLDIVRCGAGWCGTEVTASGGCGRTALRLEAARNVSGSIPSFAGRLEVMSEAEPYVVSVTVKDQGNAAALWMLGHTGTTLLPRRVYQLDAHFVRLGDPACTEPKLS